MLVWVLRNYIPLQVKPEKLDLQTIWKVFWGKLSFQKYQVFLQMKLIRWFFAQKSPFLLCFPSASIPLFSVFFRFFLNLEPFLLFSQAFGKLSFQKCQVFLQMNLIRWFFYVFSMCAMLALLSLIYLFFQICLKSFRLFCYLVKLSCLCCNLFVRLDFHSLCFMLAFRLVYFDNVGIPKLFW